MTQQDSEIVMESSEQSVRVAGKAGLSSATATSGNLIPDKRLAEGHHCLGLAEEALEHVREKRTVVGGGVGLLDSPLPQLATRSSSAQLKVESETQVIQKQQRIEHDYDQQHCWQTLEDETAKGNYQYWLQEHDIAHIARVIFGYDEGYRKCDHQTQFSEETESGKAFYDKTSSKTVFVVCDLNSLSKRLANFKNCVNKRNEQRTLTAVINLGGGHWVTLVVAQRNGQHDAYYSDSVGSELIPENIEEELKNNLPGSVDIIHLQVKQQKDAYNCGVFALENSHVINEALQKNKPLDEMIQKLKYNLNYQQLKERREGLVENLLKDHARRRFVIVNFSIINKVETSLQPDGLDLNVLGEELLRTSLDLNNLLKTSIEKQYLVIATFAVEQGADTSDLSIVNKKKISDYIRKYCIEHNQHINDFLSTIQHENPNPVNRRLIQSSGFLADREMRVGNGPNNNQDNTDLHIYASSGSLIDFEASFKKNKKDNPDNYLQIVSQYNDNHETALFLAIENENFDIGICLLKELTDEQKYHQLELFDSVNSEKFDKFRNYADIKGEKKIAELLSHKASKLKSNRHGGDYQSKLLMFFAYVGHNADIQFRLGTEVHDADKFDDLVFRYRDESSSCFKYSFLQSKHIQYVKGLQLDGLLGHDKRFALKQYFISYLQIKEKFDDGIIEDFIICTTESFAFDVKELHLQPIGEQERNNKYKIISDLGGQVYKFDSQIDCEKLMKILTSRIQDLRKPKTVEKQSQNLNKANKLAEFLNELKQHSNHVGEFLSKLVFAVKQPSSKDLSKKIEERMGSDTYNFIYFATFKEYIDEWFAFRHSNDTARFILSSEIKDFFYGLENKIASIELIGLGSLFKKKIENFTKLELAFNSASEDVRKIEIFLNSNDHRILKLSYKEKDSLLSIAKVHQILKKKFQDTLQYTISDLRSLSSLYSDGTNQDRVVKAFNSENKRLFAIDCNSIDDDGKNVLRKLSDALTKNSVSSKKVILVLNEELNEQLNKILPNLSNHILMENSLNSFTTKSKNTIEKKEIMLFGESRLLSSLTTDASKDDLYSAIDGDALTTLINSDSNIIGRKHDYDFETYIEIPRTLTYLTNINKECLKEHNNDLFALSSIKLDEFYQLVPEREKSDMPNNQPSPQIREFIDPDPNKNTQPIRFIRLDNHRDVKKDFEQLCRDYKENTIHWLENKDHVLEWKQTRGSLFNLRRFLINTDTQTKPTTDLTDSAIITAEAGIGKSTLLTTCSISSNSLWPIRFNLKDYQKDINDAKLDDMKGVLKFLCNFVDPAGSKTSLIKNLLQYCLKQREVTLLLDGYDEIQHDTREKVVQLCKTLKTTQGIVLVTTRCYAQSELEDALGIFACSLNPFDEEEQKGFLKKFWIKKLNQVNPTQEKKIDEFTKQLLNYFHELNLMKKEGLVGIALQARMVAEIFQDECREYLQHNKIKSSNFEISNIYDLYEKFIKYQYKRYFKEKIKISEKLREDLHTSLTRSYTKAHGYLALKSLFSDDQIKGLLSQERFSVQGLQVIGLVKTLQNNGTADFLHPTYAEYFAADLLTNALRKKEDHPKYRAVRYFLLMQIFRDRNQVIRNFFKSKIEKAKDTDLNSKWKEIQDCDLWKDVVTRVKLQLNPPDNASFEKSLSELQEEVEKCMKWSGENYSYYNDKDTELIQKFFQKFFRETDVEVLKPTLEFVLKVNGKSLYHNANYMFRNLISAAVSHYLTHVIQLNTLSAGEIENRDDLIKAMIGEAVFYKLNKMADDSGFLMREKIGNIKKLIELNNFFYILDTFYSTTSQKVRSYISSTENTLKNYTTRIINSLKDMNCGNNGIINSELEHVWLPKSSFINILYHPGVIAYTKSSINEIYKDNDFRWLERQGILISRVLEILTPEMSERFNSGLDGRIYGGTYIYSEGIFVDLICYIVNRIAVDNLPQVDKLAFLKMLVRFVGFSVERARKLPFTSEQLMTTLKLITDILNEQRELGVSKSIEYLSILGKAGLKLIHVEKELLVIDPAGEFEYKLSSDYIIQVIELIKFKNTKPSEFQEKFQKECIKIKKGRKRRVSESDLQELKRLKVEN